MNEAQTKAMRRTLLRAATRSAERPYHFFYCQEAGNGEPALLVGKRLTPGDIRAIRRAAKKKKFVRGIVYGDSGRLTFKARDPSAGQFPRKLRLFFGARVRSLKKARVIGFEEDNFTDEPDAPSEETLAPLGESESDEQRAAAEALEAARTQLDGAQESADQAQRAVQAAEDMLSELIDQTPGLSLLDGKASVLEEEASTAAERLLDLQDTLGAAELALTEQTALLDGADTIDPADALALGEAARKVATLREELRAEAAMTATLDMRAREARAEVTEAVAGTPALAEALRARDAAAAALDHADEIESLAEDAIFAAEEASEDADRHARLAPQHEAAQAAIDRHAETIATLKDINPRDPGRKDRKRIEAAGAGAVLADLQAELDRLIAAGATLEDVRPLFEALPSAWRPAALTDHILWFERLQAWETAMDSARRAAQQQEEIEAMLRGGNSDATRDAKLAIQEYYAENTDQEVPDGVEVNDAAELLALLKAAGRDAAQQARSGAEDPALTEEVQGVDGYSQADDPVLKRMRDERMLELAASLGEEGISWLSLLATEVPEIAVVLSGMNLARELTLAGLRIVKQVRTASLVKDAVAEDSVTAEALRQAKTREGILALHHSINAVSSAFDVATDLAVLGGVVTLPIAFAIKIGSSIVTSEIHKQLVTDRERKMVARAEEYKKLALAGDPEAARKLFRYSKRYAKGMLAWLAVSGDDIAQKYAQMQGIPAEELEKTCPAVLQRYLLRAARELDEADETPSWLAKVSRRLKKLMERLGTWLLKKYESFDRFFAGPKKSALPEVHPVPASTLAALHKALADFAEKRAFLALRPTKNALLIMELDEVREVFDRESEQLQQTVADNLVWLGDRQQSVARQLADEADEAGEALGSRGRQKLERLTERLQRASQNNVHLMQQLAAMP